MCVLRRRRQRDAVSRQEHLQWLSEIITTIILSLNRKYFKELCLTAGLPDESRLHALRHTHATQVICNNPLSGLWYVALSTVPLRYIFSSWEFVVLSLKLPRQFRLNNLNLYYAYKLGIDTTLPYTNNKKDPGQSLSSRDQTFLSSNKIIQPLS